MSIHNQLKKVVGYGTFITELYYDCYERIPIKPCKVLDYVRILPKGHPFPYVLPKQGDAFWALLFSVTKIQLDKLDFYEGVDVGIYRRERTQVKLKTQKLIKAFIYVPTEKTIQEEDLSYETDKEDRWQDEIKNHPKIVKNFPELVKR
ncbi:MAG: gamma-glutamylcyclotransferase family protein [Promethearchaeia archaeon]